MKQHQQHQKRRNSKKMEILSSKNTKMRRRIWKTFLIKNFFHKTISQLFSLFYFILAFQNNLLSLNLNNEPATKSIVQLSALEAESIVEYFIATMYAANQQEPMHMMNGNMIESMIPGSTGISPSPTIMHQQNSSDLYSNGGVNMSANSLRTHSSKFPVSSY